MNTEAGGHDGTSSFRPMARKEDLTHLTDQQFDELCQQHGPTYLHRRSERAAPVVPARTILTITYENGFPEFSYGSHGNVAADDTAEETDPDSNFQVQPMAREEDLTDQQLDELCQPMYLRRRSGPTAPVAQARTILEITFENGFPEFSDGTSYNDVAADDAEDETDPDSDTDTAAEDGSDAQTDEDGYSDDETTQPETGAGSGGETDAHTTEETDAVSDAETEPPFTN